MDLDKTLNLVIPFGNKRIFHTPISADVFEMNFRLLAATKVGIFAKGIHYAIDAGPVIATLCLKEEGVRLAKEQQEEGDSGAQSLLGEIKRLTTVLKPTDEGWETVPANTGLDKDEWKEVEASLVFFTCFYWMARASQRKAIADGAASGLGGEITSLPLPRWIDSFPPETSPTT